MLHAKTMPGHILRLSSAINGVTNVGRILRSGASWKRDVERSSLYIGPAKDMPQLSEHVRQLLQAPGSNRKPP